MIGPTASPPDGGLSREEASHHGTMGSFCISRGRRDAEKASHRSISPPHLKTSLEPNSFWYKEPSIHSPTLNARAQPQWIGMRLEACRNAKDYESHGLPRRTQVQKPRQRSPSLEIQNFPRNTHSAHSFSIRDLASLPNKNLGS